VRPAAKQKSRPTTELAAELALIRDRVEDLEDASEVDAALFIWR